MFVCIALLAGALVQLSAQQAESLVDAGVELSHQGRFQEAADKFVQALVINPKLAEAHYLLGLVRQQEGRTDSALSSFRSAVQINPRYAEAQARVCELVTAVARARETGFAQAQASCRRAILLDATDPETHFHLGWTEAKLGNQARAIQEYQTSLRLDPKFPHVKFELAMAYVDTQNAERAIPLLRDVVAAEPGNTAARFQLGILLAKTGDCASAVPLLETAGESDRKYYVLANCLKKLNREAEAAEAFAKVKELRAGSDVRLQAKYRAALGLKLAEAGKLDEAITEYRAALDLGKDLSIAIDLAVVLLRKEQQREVIALLGKESDPLAQYQVALAYTKLGSFADAGSLLESVVRARPKFVEAWYQLGVTALAIGKTDESERAFRTAVQLRPDESALRLAWAEALQKLGKHEEANQQIQLARQMTK